MVDNLGVCTLPKWQEYFNGLSKFLTGSTWHQLLCSVVNFKLKKIKIGQIEHTHGDTNMCIFVLSWSLPSQFIELSHPQVEAFNLDSGVTQPQLSPTAAATIVTRLKIQWKSSWREWNDKRECVSAFYTHLREIFHLLDDPVLRRYLRCEKGKQKISFIRFASRPKTEMLVMGYSFDLHTHTHTHTLIWGFSLVNLLKVFILILKLKWINQTNN